MKEIFDILYYDLLFMDSLLVKCFININKIKNFIYGISSKFKKINILLFY